MDGDFPWVLVGVFLLWLFNILGGRKRTKVERPERPPAQQPPRPPRPPRPQHRVPEQAAGRQDPTQSEGGRLEALLRALEQRLDPAAAPLPRPRPPGQPRANRPALGRPASAPLPEAEDLEERESLESEPVIESLEAEVRRPERETRDWLRQAEERDRARLAEVDARDRVSHKARHAEFDRRIRAEPAAPPFGTAGRRLTTEQIRQAFIWGEILARPRGER